MEINSPIADRIVPTNGNETSVGGSSQGRQQRAMNYLKSANIDRQLENIVNQVCLAEPRDPFSFMKNELENLCSPAKIVSLDLLAFGSSRFLLSITLSHSADRRLSESTTVCVRGDSGRKFEKNFRQVVAASSLIGQEIRGQEDVDRKLMDGEENLGLEIYSALSENSNSKIESTPRKTEKTEEDILHRACVLASRLVCQMSAHLHLVPLYRHLAEQFQKTPKLPQVFHPFLVGSECSGKLRALDRLLISYRKGRLCEGGEMIQKLVSECCRMDKKVAARAGGDGVTMTGLDRLETVLELLQESSKSLGLDFRQDFGVIIVANNIYRQDKQRYEVSQANLKSSSEVTAYWAKIVADFPSVENIISPFQAKDWTTTCDDPAVANLLAQSLEDRAWRRSSQNFWLNGWRHCTEINDYCALLSGRSSNLNLACRSEFDVDLAVAMALPAVSLCPSGSSQLLARLVFIEFSLRQQLNSSPRLRLSD